MDADEEVDHHYVILGLPSGEQGAKLSEEEIRKAYISKIEELHPDKRPDDPNAHQDFLNVIASYRFLMDKIPKVRQSFDDERRIMLGLRNALISRRAQFNTRRH